MALRCILSVMSQFSGFKLEPGPTHVIPTYLLHMLLTFAGCDIEFLSFFYPQDPKKCDDLGAELLRQTGVDCFVNVIKEVGEMVFHLFLCFTLSFNFGTGLFIYRTCCVGLLHFVF